MAGSDEITDRHSLLAWLNTRPQADSVAMAHLAALRVLPLWGRAMAHDWSRDADFTALPVLRVLLTLGVAHKYPTRGVIRDASAAAGHAVRAGFARAAATDDSVNSLAASAARAGASAGIAVSAVSEEYAANCAASNADFVSAVSTYLGDLFAADNVAAAASAVWKQIRNDAAALEQGIDPCARPLWRDGSPKWFSRVDSEMRAIWATDPPTHWDFWTRWWDGVLAGEPLNWDLQHDIAVIPDAVWETGPGPVAEAIAEIELRHALALTGNGERLEVNPATALIRLVGESDLPDDISAYARRKMAKSLALFDGKTDNQYAGLTSALKVIQDSLADAASLPVELFDSCASSTRLVASLIKAGNIPPTDKDELIREYVTIIRETAADILANDPKTQEVLTRRNSILGNDALLENAAAIEFVVGELVRVSEGTLVRFLPRDAAVALNPNADSADRKESSFRLAGRILRYGAIATEKLGALGVTVEKLKKTYAILKDIAEHPLFQKTIDSILRWLGLG